MKLSTSAWGACIYANKAPKFYGTSPCSKHSLQPQNFYDDHLCSQDQEKEDKKDESPQKIFLLTTFIVTAVKTRKAMSIDKTQGIHQVVALKLVDTNISSSRTSALHIATGPFPNNQELKSYEISI